MSEKNCGHCKHFHLDGMFGIWCDINDTDYLKEGDCPNFERRLMMSEKRYFKVEYDEEWYLFDSSKISEQLVKEQSEYGYGVFANSLSPSEICDLVNSLNDENEQLRQQIEEMQNDEQLYAQEILKLNKTKEEILNFKKLGGDY